MAGAVEHLDLQQTLELVPATDAWMADIVRRLQPLAPALEGRAKILDVGAAQGRGVRAMIELGHDAHGVEPADQALATAQQLAKSEGRPCTVVRGTAERLPFADASFDVVISSSVLEHVDDVDQALAEAYRVLRPGGVFWFNSASAMCPRQSEIERFPMFGWYPLALKRRVMHWAVANRPALVHGTTRPALHWWTERSARRRLAAAGFGAVRNRWELRSTDAVGIAQRLVISLAVRSSVCRRIGDIIVPGCSYAALKPETAHVTGS